MLKRVQHDGGCHFEMRCKASIEKSLPFSDFSHSLQSVRNDKKITSGKFVEFLPVAGRRVKLRNMDFSTIPSLSFDHPFDSAQEPTHNNKLIIVYWSL